MKTAFYKSLLLLPLFSVLLVGCYSAKAEFEKKAKAYLDAREKPAQSTSVDTAELAK